MTEPGLDAAFLDFIRAPDPEAHRRIHGVYVPLFAGRRRVVDLACGEGAFVGLLAEAGHEVLGVDADPGCVARARGAGLPIVHADVFDWLAAQPAESVDGLFNAHLVEHLPFEQVLALFGEARRVLAPGGVLVTVTPNVRALYSHLEMFYQHFGHVTFYHPRLLAFFAARAGFAATAEGENPTLAAPLFGPPDPARGASRPRLAPASLPLPRYAPDLPRRGGWRGGLWWRLKMGLVRLVVRPYLDPLVEDLHAALALANADRALLAAAVDAADDRAAEARRALDDALARVDRPFEVYVVARVAPAEDPGGPSRRPEAHRSASPGPEVPGGSIGRPGSPGGPSRGPGAEDTGRASLGPEPGPGGA